MADKKISELTAITAANTAADDVFAVVDTSSTETKKISRDELKTAVAQSGAEIKAAYEAEANAFTDAQFTKLTGIETSADVTGTANVTAAGALMDSEITNLAQVKAFDSSDYATAAQGTLATNALPKSGGAMTGAITTNSTFDGRDVAVDGAKLDGIATGATAYSNSDVDTHLNTSTASASEVLSWTGSDYDWVAQSGGGGGISNVVEDTTPQLGGDLDVNSKAINFGDSNGTTTNMLTFGAGGDLKIYHHATAGTYITENGTGNLNLLAGDLRLMNAAGSTTLRSQLSGIQISNSYTLPTADGTSGQVMTTDGAGTVSFTTVSGGGGADLYAANESSPAAQPSATGGNAIAIGDTAQAAGADGVAIGLQSYARQQSALGIFGDAQAIESICIGKLSAVTADGAVQLGRQGFATNTNAVSLGRSRASGVTSFAAQINTNSASYGAIGANSIAIGIQAKASSARGVAIGAYALSSSTSIALSTGWNNNITTASGSNSVAIGGNTSATSAGSYAFGQQSSSAIRGKYAYAAGRFAATGDAQGGQFILRADTTDATATVLTTNNSTAAADNQIAAASDTCITFDGTITAMQNGAQSYASWRVEGLLVNDAGTTTVANSAITVIDNQSNWGLTLTADNGNSALAITFTGEASHNIRTVANIRTTEVTYA